MRRALKISLLLAPLLVACGGDSVRPNVLLITVDTLRADHLSPWGYGRPTSPAIARLAGQSVVFLDAQSAAPWTLPSLAALLTSQYASTLDIWGYGSYLDTGFTTLAERLRAAGYTTYGIGSHIYLGSRFGLQQGFDGFDEDLVRGQIASQMAISSPGVTERAVAWLKEHGAAGPWLLWAHYFDPHALYQPHPGVSERFGTVEKSDLYDGEIAFTDAAIGEVLSALDALGLADHTIVVFTADHGEEFGEHGGTGHGSHVHAEVVHVPLLFRVPGVAPRRIEARVRTIDVLPTLLDLVGLPPDDTLEGSSLAGALRDGKVTPRAAISEVRLHGLQDSLSLGRWKVVRDHGAKQASLYDLQADPGEQHDVAKEHPAVVRKLGAELGELVREAEAKGRAVERHPAPPISKDDHENLKALGYVR